MAQNIADKETSIQTLDDLVQDAHNANLGTERGEFALRESLMRYGVGRGVLADRHGRLIGGNKTAGTLDELGEDVEVVVVPSTGKTLVVTQRVDLDLDDPDDPTARELAFADNRVQELNLAWDAQEVAAGVEDGLDLAVFFRQNELEALAAEAAALFDADEAEDAQGDDEDPVPEMEVLPFEHWDYVMIVFRNTWDWAQAVDVLGITPRGYSFESSKGQRHRKIGMCRVLDGRRFMEMLEELRVKS